MAIALTLILAASQAQAERARIVSLTPAATEILFAVGAGPDVVGVSQYCNYPPPARSLPRIGSYLAPNLETIVALRPTLIVGPLTAANERTVASLRAMGYTVLLADDDSVRGIEDSIGKIGARTGHPAQARAVLTKIHAQFALVRRRLAGLPPVRVLMVVGHNPLIAVGDGGYLDDLLRAADDDNVAAKMGTEWPRISLEYVIAAAPQVILDGAMGTEARASQSFWGRFATLPAVRDHRVIRYPLSPILHPGPRIGKSLDIIAALTHPAAFPAAAGEAASAHRPGAQAN